MLFLPVGASKPIRIQGALVTENEVEGIVSYIMKQGKPLYIASFPDQSQVSVVDKTFEDDLFTDAARLVMDRGMPPYPSCKGDSASATPGAGRLMDILEERGHHRPLRWGEATRRTDDQRAV